MIDNTVLTARERNNAGMRQRRAAQFPSKQQTTKVQMVKRRWSLGGSTCSSTIIAGWGDGWFTTTTFWNTHKNVVILWASYIHRWWKQSYLPTSIHVQNMHVTPVWLALIPETYIFGFNVLDLTPNYVLACIFIHANIYLHVFFTAASMCFLHLSSAEH